MNEISIVFVTAASQDEATRIAQTLVEERFAACANIVAPIRSIYRWKGKICDEQEFLIIFKTRTSKFESIQKRVKELHSYEVPEIVSFPLQRGLPQYLDWVMEQTETETQ
jgi:periplasmic divalent cation tolerance protein